MAVFMACGHAKFTEEVGICLATSGPGAFICSTASSAPTHVRGTPVSGNQSSYFACAECASRGEQSPCKPQC